MRASLAALSALALWGCVSGEPGRPAPTDRFYYPAGLVHVDVDGGQGVLYVANANFDKRYTASTLLAVDLDAVGLPPFGAPVPATGPLEIPDLAIGDQASVLIADFANEMSAYPIDGGVRLFVPSRAEDNRLNIVDAQGTSLTCFNNPAVRDCGAKSPDLTSLASPEDGTPQAPQPNGVGISDDGQVMVTHQGPAKLASSTANGTYYVVQMDALNPELSVSSYVPISPCSLGTCVGGSQSVAVGARYGYVTGKIGAITTTTTLPATGFGGTTVGTNIPADTTVALPGNILRFVERHPDVNGVQRVGSAGLELAFQLFEGRGVGVNQDESRIYVVARGLDSFVASGPTDLIVVAPIGPLSDDPQFPIANVVPLPERGDALRILPRVGKSDLVLITCEDAGALVIYDDEEARIVANLTGLGEQPDGMAVAMQGKGARIYVGSFTSGQVAVVDMPDLDRPQDLQVVARLGQSQVCVTRPNDPFCLKEATP